MSAGPSLYRRHRPRSFADVVGQEQIVRTLSNAVRQDKVHHAYLFVGSRGTGKTSTAKILAACLNCEQGPTVEPCGVCDSCVSIANATSLDVIEMDAASNNSVDDIRDLREKVTYSPVSGRHKVYILDEAHMLSSQAWNAFLKTLEEPPPRTIFVLATTEAQKVLPTVVDRCHRFDFGRPTVEQVAQVLGRVAASEQIDIEPGAVALIARHATGSFRDALGTLEQLVTYAGDEQIKAADVLAVLGVADAEQLFEAVDAIQAGDPAQALRTAARLTGSGRDPGQILRDLEVHGRELMAVQILEEVPDELRITPERDARLLTQAQALPASEVVRLLDLVAGALEATANGAQSRIQLELVLIKAASPEVDPSTAALLARIERLENALRAGGPATRGERPEPVVTRTTPATEAARAQPPATEAARAQSATTEAARAQSATPNPEPASPRPIPATVIPAPVEPKAAAPGETELGTLVSSWPAVVEFVRQENAMLAATLETARPVTLNDQALTLAFPAGAAFFKRKAEQDDYRRAAADAVRSVTGARLTLRYELRDDAPVTVENGAELTGEELVQRFMEEFDAEEVLDDDPDQEEA
ncbi:MAG TPA: DNA polymerase III subunit gamma/tau [Solirubrobacteraceae bacterium]